jgi:methionyl-tRNA formyltransferase
MRIIYLGTPEASVRPLRALVEAGHDIALVVTQPDKRRSRGTGADPSPVKRAAAELGLRVATPDKAREIIDAVARSGASAGVVVAFGQLLPVALLETLPLGFVNLHFSLLPRWRGAAPVERAILAGDAETGVCLMRVEAGLDTGPVFGCARTPIATSDTAGSLGHRLVDIGTALLLEHLPRLGEEQPVPQLGDPTYADKLTTEEFRLDPARPATELVRVVQAGDPRPGAWVRAAGQRYKVFGASAAPDRERAVAPGVLGARGLGTGDGLLELREIQPEGKRRMPWDAWRRGHPDDVPIDA